MSSISTLRIYRDCLRLVRHTAGNTKKGDLLRNVVRGEFLKNRAETDPTRIEDMRAGATRALSNYLTLDSLSKLENKNN
jgi:hypothetical protein